MGSCELGLHNHGHHRPPPFPLSSHSQLTEHHPAFTGRRDKMSEWEWTRREQYKFFNSWAANLVTAYNPEEAAAGGAQQRQQQKAPPAQGVASNEKSPTDDSDSSSSGQQRDSSPASGVDCSSQQEGREESRVAAHGVQSEDPRRTEPSVPSSTSAPLAAPTFSQSNVCSQMTNQPPLYSFQLSFPLTNNNMHTQSRLVSSSGRSSTARFPQQQTTTTMPIPAAAATSLSFPPASLSSFPLKGSLPSMSRKCKRGDASSMVVAPQMSLSCGPSTWAQCSQQSESRRTVGNERSSSKGRMATVCSRLQSGNERKRRTSSFITILTRRELYDGSSNVIIDASIERSSTRGFDSPCRSRTGCPPRKREAPSPALPPRRLLLRQRNSSSRAHRRHARQTFQHRRSPLSQISISNSASFAPESVDADDVLMDINAVNNHPNSARPAVALADSSRNNNRIVLRAIDAAARSLGISGADAAENTSGARKDAENAQRSREWE